jgi:hypothetical protein
MDKVEKRFLEVAQNKDITDDDIFEELCYVHAKTMANQTILNKEADFCLFKKIRVENPSLKKELYHVNQGLQLGNPIDHYVDQFSFHHYYVEKYEMKQRIRSLEQTLATFMEQTKVERLSQEAVMQSISNELDEFQEEFYDCQSEVKEQEERIGLLEDALKETIQIVLGPVPFVKDKMA